MRGLFITLEGPDGSGKSTLLKHLLPLLEKQLKAPLIVTREPGGTPISEKIRDLILDPENVQMDTMTEALLYAASRRQHVMQRVLPALEKGNVVLSDRYLDSSYAYQGYGREIGGEKILDLNQYATDGLLPNVTLYCRLSAKEGIERIQKYRTDDQDRLEREAIAFHERVVDGFEEMIKKQEERFIVVDARQTPEEMVKIAYFALVKRYPDWFKEGSKHVFD